MEPIAIVKKRSRIWLVMALLIIIMLLAAAALWFMGDTAPATNVSRLWQGGEVLSPLMPGESWA
jgi:predicted S18 family serine protease